MTTKQASFEDLIDTLEPVRVRDGWLHNSMIFVECGIGYGLTTDCRNVCLGDMAAVELYLSHGIDKGFSQKELEVLRIVKEIERINGERESVNTANTKLRTPDVKQRNNKRVRLSGNARNNSKHFKPVKVKSKLSLHPVR